MGEFKHPTADAVLLYLISRWLIYSDKGRRILQHPDAGLEDPLQPEGRLKAAPLDF
jgi:hypothetical protein